jgi:hypothetical protein
MPPPPAASPLGGNPLRARADLQQTLMSRVDPRPENGRVVSHGLLARPLRRRRERVLEGLLGCGEGRRRGVVRKRYYFRGWSHGQTGDIPRILIPVGV